MTAILSCSWWTILLFVLSSTSKAELTAQDVPSCARHCILNSSTDSSSSNCPVGPSESVYGALAPCFESSCSAADSLSALNVTSIMCDEPVRDLSVAYRAVVVCAAVLISLITTARLWVKMRNLAGSIGWDDWCIVIAVGVGTPGAAAAYLAGHYGIGRDIWKLTSHERRIAMIATYCGLLAYKICITAIRQSVLFFYLRVFSVSNFRNTVIGLMVANVMSGIAFTLADALQCMPPWLFWSDGEVKHQCSSLETITWVHGISNIVMDVFALVIALWMVQRLRMRWRRKATVFSMFALGSAITLMSFLRLQSVPRLHNMGNVTWNFAPIGIWSDVEILIGLGCACAPALKAFGPILRGQRGTQQNSTSGYVRQPSDRNTPAFPGPASSSSSSRAFGGAANDPTMTFTELADLEESRPETKGGDDNSVFRLVHIRSDK
ncbi:hypothetical protein F4778DRAFT_783077 [Xylariomycetidae sp. FL2044]|nr:hypothetical protein F4778DRAFT_783077 [Xylariomycetidae sp. FL2044]